MACTNMLSTKDENDQSSHFSFLKEELMWRDVILILVLWGCTHNQIFKGHFYVALASPLNISCAPQFPTIFFVQR